MGIAKILCMYITGHDLCRELSPIEKRALDRAWKGGLDTSGRPLFSIGQSQQVARALQSTGALLVPPISIYIRFHDALLKAKSLLPQ